MPDWATYRIEFEHPTYGAYVIYVRAIGERDARYVATTPCKRNGQRAMVPAGVEFTATKESA